MSTDSIYKKLYFILFNAVTDALRALDDFDGVSCRKILMNAQARCEELYISQKHADQN